MSFVVVYSFNAQVTLCKKKKESQVYDPFETAWLELFT